ncbi:hypothetical protein FK535_19695 [Mycolicibacterium sp. 018/SC-01/001]|uniref:hypothetical protein n=1 Tax=Mycolicibacterium sp. 018/SC-01/001 TaxID=2592069 RepID=UPI0011815AC9|nr:hypothetical protein [Mycolicibacterium sp. 018/SC-01/001]TRW80259.1 hypothetical protein FK535_19695 [Mycolicibacterium sp. 018/SC-01/001]
MLVEQPAKELSGFGDFLFGASGSVVQFACEFNGFAWSPQVVPTCELFGGRVNGKLQLTSW